MALEQFEKCLAIDIKALGEDNPSVTATYINIATTKYNMASSLEEQGELARAGGLFRESASIYSKVLGAEHEETLDALERGYLAHKETHPP
ncbi:hypothetical protein T484DRAFT_1809335 [Baffinella frigidus]|nr:hypothetical protein T484DRAFT_1809335 [Cryptophyta sp. CCMP2293]